MDQLNCEQTATETAKKHKPGALPVRHYTADEIAAVNAALGEQKRELTAANTLGPLPRDATKCVGGLDQWRQEWTKFLQAKGASHAVTFAFNQPITLEGARERLRKFLQQLDRQLLGPRYRKKTNERTFAVAIAENIKSNLHFHAVFAVAPEHQETFLAVAEMIWEQLFPSGDLKIEATYDLAGAVAYMTKHANNQDVFNSLTLSSEFQAGASV